MKAFHKKSGFGQVKGGKKFGGPSGYVSKPWGDRTPRSNDSSRPDLHRATCNECGNSCEVPFKPNGSKPIYCSSCFRRDENGGDSRPSYGDKPSYGNKPAYGSKPAFEKRSYGSNSECKCKNMDEQFAALNAKVDALTKALNAKMF